MPKRGLEKGTEPSCASVKLDQVLPDRLWVEYFCKLWLLAKPFLTILENWILSPIPEPLNAGLKLRGWGSNDFLQRQVHSDLSFLVGPNKIFWKWT